MDQEHAKKFPLLSQNIIWQAMSDLGKATFLPEGVPFWAGRAKKESKINATIGSATDEDGNYLYLPSMTLALGSDFLKKVGARVLDYAAVPGLPPFRERWKQKLLKTHPSLEGVCPLPVVTSGITHSLYIAGQLFLNPGETLDTYGKYWENYDQTFERLTGARIEPAELFTPKKGLNVQSLIEGAKASLERQGKAVILLNFPQNQSGYSPTHTEAAALAKSLHDLAEQNKNKPMVVILDDAYEGFVYDDKAVNTSLASKLYDPNSKNLSVVKLDGISKVMLAYGLRVAFMTIFCPPKTAHKYTDEELAQLSKELTSKVGGFVRGETSNASHLSQATAEYAFEQGNPEGELPERINLLGERWKLMQEEIAKQEKLHPNSPLTVSPFNSGFFCYFDLDPKIPATEFAERLMPKVGVVPASKQRDGKLLWNGIRVAFCSVPKAKIPEMLQAIFETASEFKWRP